MEQELGSRLPEDVRVVAVEETLDTIYLVLPNASTAGAEDGALSDRQLQSVAGGYGPFDGYTGQPETCVAEGKCEEIAD